MEGTEKKRLFPFGFGLLFEPSEKPTLTVEHSHELLPRTNDGPFSMAHKLMYRASSPIAKGDVLSIPGFDWSGQMGFQVMDTTDSILPGHAKGESVADVFEQELSLLQIPEYSEAPLRFGASPLHGMGVFATRDIQAGEVLEMVPTVPAEKYNIFTNTLLDYAYAPPFTKKMVVLQLGFGMVYNHSEKPNALHRIVRSNNDDFPLAEVWTAASFIPEGAEVFHNYGPNWWTERGERL
jgi:hypothetical protein